MRRWLHLVLQVASLLLFGLILAWSGPEVWVQIARGNRRDILASFLLLGIASMLSALRLKIVTRAMTQRRVAAWSRFYHLTMTTRALGLVVPRTLSTVGGKALGLSRLGVAARRAIWIVVLDSGFDIGLLGVFGLPALLLLHRNAPLWEYAMLALLALVALTGGLLWITGPGRFASLLQSQAGVFLLRSVLKIEPETTSTLSLLRPVALRALALTFVFNSVLSVCYYYIARAVGVPGPGILFIAGFPITQLSLIVAVTPGGLGLVEAGWYGVLLLGGLAKQDSLAFVVGQRAYILVYVLIWASVSALISLVAQRGIHD